MSLDGAKITLRRRGFTLSNQDSSPAEGPSELFHDELTDDVEKSQPKADVSKGGLKFGWIQGVLVGCTYHSFELIQRHSV